MTEAIERQDELSLDDQKTQWEMRVLAAASVAINIVNATKHAPSSHRPEDPYLLEVQKIYREIADYEKRHNISLEDFKNKLEKDIDFLLQAGLKEAGTNPATVIAELLDALADVLPALLLRRK